MKAPISRPQFVESDVPESGETLIRQASVCRDPLTILLQEGSYSHQRYAVVPLSLASDGSPYFAINARRTLSTVCSLPSGKYSSRATESTCSCPGMPIELTK